MLHCTTDFTVYVSPGTYHIFFSSGRYHVYVDGFLKTTVRASDKTRALVEGD